MGKGTGILLDENGDIMVRNGSMVVGDTTKQNQYLIMIAQKGELKEFPTFGVGISDMLHDDDELEWKKRIGEEFEKDDLEVDNIDLDLQTGKIVVEAKYRS